MEAQDLRIGNLVYKMKLNVNNGKYEFPVVTVDYHILFDLINQNKVTIEPIELTEEWLLKAGFEKDGDGILCLDYSEGDMLMNWPKELRFYWVQGGEESFLQVANGCAAIFNYKHIKFFHQLQNIIFALTGKELIFKE